MARQICQGGPGDTRLGAVLGDKQLSPRISSRCHLSDETRANGIVFSLCVYERPPPLLLPPPTSSSLLPSFLPLSVSAISFATLFVSGSSGKRIHATMLVVKCIVGSEIALSWIEERKARPRKEDITSPLHLRSRLPSCDETPPLTG